MNGKKMLILRLEGILQSWDTTSKWDDRESEDFPSKSGIVGLLGCALGLERGTPELVELNSALVMAIRADRPGSKLVDFQTVTGKPLMNAMGKPKTTGNTFISKRVYLQDACFTVFIEMDEIWHSRIVASLKAPKWCLYLGRKSCVPSRPVLECEDFGDYSLKEALRKYPIVNRDNKDIFPILYETEQSDDELPSTTRPDNLVGENRTFIRRKIWKGQINKEETPCT